jgi:hypothetical protein
MVYHHGFSGGMDIAGRVELATGNLNNGVIAGMMFVANIVGERTRRLLHRGVLHVAYASSVMVGVAAWFERAQATDRGAPST